MQQVVIIFPDTEKIADFIMSRPIPRAEVNSREQTLTAPLEEDDIITACTEYGGHLNVELTPKKPSY
jgi:hypothetical protein